MTSEEIYHAYVGEALRLLPSQWKERRPVDLSPNIDPSSPMRILIEVQAAALAHVLTKLQQEEPQTKAKQS